MRSLTALAFLLTSLVCLSYYALAKRLQFPIQAPAPVPTHRPKPKVDDGFDDWRLSTSPAENATGRFVFDTVSSLLQHWTNTRYRNGHTVVPAVVPAGTLLHHGRTTNEVPSTPEWVATDPDHSYLFCAGFEGCWQLTLATIRPLKVLYFDGSSAASMRNGPMDSQDIIAWGALKPEYTWDDRKRITDLCEWGRQYELDGYVRMEMNFEIMLCSFTEGVEVVELLNLATATEPWRPQRPHTPAHDFRLRMPSLAIQVKMVESGTWTNSFPGDTRFQLDLTRLISFYDTDLAPSLVNARKGQERWEHRLAGISKLDSRNVRARLHQALDTTTRWPRTSGIDWQTLTRTIIHTYADRLEVLRNTLHKYDVEQIEEEAWRSASKAQSQLRQIITPYILHTARPPSSPEEARETDNVWAQPIFKLCATMRTRGALSAQHTRLTASEELILRGIKETTREICRVLVNAWAEGVISGVDTLLPLAKAKGSDPRLMLSQWRSQVDGLLEWLDWSIWLQCHPTCGDEEMCYLPTWPFFCPFPMPRPKDPFDPNWKEGEGNEPGWENPKPRCIRVIDPFLPWKTQP